MKINECLHDDSVTVLISNSNGNELQFSTKVIGNFSDEDTILLNKVRLKVKSKNKDNEICVVEPFFEAETIKKLMYIRDLTTGEIKKQRVVCSATIVHEKRKTYIYNYVDIMRLNLTDGREVNLIVTSANVGPINRRADYRLSMLVEADMRINNHGGIKVIQLKDLSASGVGLITNADTKIWPGDIISIDLYDASFDRILKSTSDSHYHLEFVVVRTVMVDEDSMLVGAKATREVQKQIMSRFINKKQAERSRG